MNILPMETMHLTEDLRKQLVDYTYKIVGCMHTVYKEVATGLPEPIFQECLEIALSEQGFVTHREYQHSPVFHGVTLSSHIRLDFIVEGARGNVIIECKSIQNLTDRERMQLFGYMRATEFPIGILVNFGSFPKAEIERYYFDRKKNLISAF